MLYAILLLSMVALIGAAFAFHLRVKRHMKGPGETQRREALRDDPSQQSGTK